MGGCSVPTVRQLYSIINTFMKLFDILNIITIRNWYLIACIILTITSIIVLSCLTGREITLSSPYFTKTKKDCKRVVERRHPPILRVTRGLYMETHALTRSSGVTDVPVTKWRLIYRRVLEGPVINGFVETILLVVHKIWSFTPLRRDHI